MGKSRSINLIGLGRENNKGVRPCYPANNRLEMRQMLRKAVLAGDKIEWWYAQTQTGCRSLKVADVGEWTPTPLYVMDAPVVLCPVCGDFPEEKQGCGVCNFSGITSRAWLRKYQPWQLSPLSSPNKKPRSAKKAAPQQSVTDCVAALNRQPLQRTLS